MNKLLGVYIPTYNRKKVLIDFSKSLFASNIPDWANVTVVDDYSNDISHSDLKELFPNFELTRNNENLGADENIRRLIIKIAESPEPYGLLLDSDLLVSPNLWYAIHVAINNRFPQISFYNSCLHHPVYGFKEDFNKFTLVYKQHIGSAGCMFSKSTAKMIIENVPPSRSYDWDWSAYFQKCNLPLRVTKVSYLQHIGYVGTNTNLHLTIDRGLNFDYGNDLNRTIMLRILEDTIDMQLEIFNNMCKTLENHYEKSYALRLGRLLLFPFSYMAKLFIAT